MSMSRKYNFSDLIRNLCNSNERNLRDCIDLIKSNNLDRKLLNEEEADMLYDFERLYDDLGSIPTFEMFKCHYPNIRIDSDIETDDIMALTRIFIRQRKNVIASNLLIDEAKKIPTEGITQEIVESISNILKSDAVKIKYENIKDKIVDIYNRSIDNSGIKTGIEAIDREIGGLKAGQVSVLAGFTGMGKSICSVSIMHSALEQGYNVCYLSLELSKEHLMYNLISRHSLEPKFSKKIEHRDLKSKTLSEEDWNFTKDKIIPDLDTLPGNFYILDEQDIEAYNYFAFDNKLQEIENLCIKETGKGLDLVIVDHVQMLAYSKHDSKKDESTIINGWCNYFRSNCFDFLKSNKQIHVILVSQINRQGYLKAVKRNGMYDMTALKEANELETCAAVILGIFSDTSLVISNQARVGILKNRDGSRVSEAYTVPADFPHQLIGSLRLANPLTDKLNNFGVYDSAFDDNISMNFDGFNFDGLDSNSTGPIDLSTGMEE